MEPLSDILDRLFTMAAPCTGCARRVPTYRDPETGRAYCLPCLEEAVIESQAEIAAERQEMALLACWGHEIAPRPLDGAGLTPGPTDPHKEHKPCKQQTQPKPRR